MRKFYEAMGWIAVLIVRYAGIRSSNRDSLPAQVRKGIQECLGRYESDGAAASVRRQLYDYCGSPNVEACYKRGGLEQMAELALKNHCGNCAEKSAVALTWLKSVRVRPLDFMELGANNGIDHSFVVMGRVRNSVASQPSTWGADAVVCDPWHNQGEVYAASDIDRRMFRGRGTADSPSFSGPIWPRSVIRVD